MLKLKHLDRALRYEARMDELKARQEDRHRFTGMEVIVLPDDDDRLKDIADDCMGTDGNKFYVRESLWPKIRDQLIRLSSNE